MALVLIGLVAAACLLSSALAPALRLPAALLALAQGLLLARRETGLAPRQLAWAGGDAEATVSGPGGVETWRQVRVHVRGPIAVLSGRDASGRRRPLVWWPDTLPPSARRQLRLAASVSGRSENPLPSVSA